MGRGFGRGRRWRRGIRRRWTEGRMPGPRRAIGAPWRAECKKRPFLVFSLLCPNPVPLREVKVPVINFQCRRRIVKVCSEMLVPSCCIDRSRQTGRDVFQNRTSSRGDKHTNRPITQNIRLIPIWAIFQNAADGMPKGDQWGKASRRCRQFLQDPPSPPAHSPPPRNGMNKSNLGGVSVVERRSSQKCRLQSTVQRILRLRHERP